MKYMPNPINTSNIKLDDSLLELTEMIAANTHDVWAKSRINQGWTFGVERNDEKKQTPCLVPYEQLSDEEKNYDRNTAMETIKLLVVLGYTITKRDGAKEDGEKR